MNQFGNMPKALLMGAALGAVAQRFPHIARAMEFEQQIERISEVYFALGAERADVDRMRTFVTALAHSTLGRNTDMIMAATEYNRRRMAKGEPLIPSEIKAWAWGFWNDGAGTIIDSSFRELYQATMFEAGMEGVIAARFIADAKRLWEGST